MVDKDLIERLQKENLLLKRQLDKKVTDEYMSNNEFEQEKSKETTLQKENSVRDRSEAGYSYSTNTNKVLKKEKKLLSTKTYTSKNDINSTTSNK